jgi:hypothetical protein
MYVPGWFNDSTEEAGLVVTGFCAAAVRPISAHKFPLYPKISARALLAFPFCLALVAPWFVAEDSLRCKIIRKVIPAIVVSRLNLAIRFTIGPEEACASQQTGQFIAKRLSAYLRT